MAHFSSTTNTDRPRRFIGLVGARALVIALVAGASAVVVGSGADAAASTMQVRLRLTHTRVLPYPMEQVWPTALRYLRVDRGYAIVDRDAEAGYILFDFSIDGSGEGSNGGASAGDDVRVGRGSLELLATKDASGRPSVKLQVSTDAGPTHLPHAIAEGLAAKIKAERGQPAPPPPRDDAPKAPPKSPPDADDPPAVHPSELSSAMAGEP